MSNNHIIYLCKNCVNFIKEKNKVECELGFFSIKNKKIVLFSPIDFNCIDFEVKK